LDTFGNRLIEFRKKLGHSQVEFANVMGIKNQSLLRYEKNLIKPSFEFISKLTILFPDSIQYLLSGENIIKNNRVVTIPVQINSHLSEKEVEILKAYRELEQEDQEIFYFELKAAAAKARKKAKDESAVLLEDVKSAG
jgi:transcriptional regulator with XRE-family HTH domain